MYFCSYLCYSISKYQSWYLTRGGPVGRLLYLVKQLRSRRWELWLYVAAGFLTLVSFAVRGHWVTLPLDLATFLNYYTYDLAGPTLAALLMRVAVLVVYRPFCRLVCRLLNRPFPQRGQFWWVTQRPLVLAVFVWGVFQFIELWQYLGMYPPLAKYLADQASWGDVWAFTLGGIATAVCLLRSPSQLPLQPHLARPAVLESVGG